MALIDVKFDMKEIENILKEYTSKIKNIPMSVIAEMLATEIDDEIQTEGRGRWPAFALETIKRHPERAGGSLLQDKGILANIQKKIGNNWAKAYSKRKFARFHVTGTKNMPARNFLDIQMEKVLEEMAAYITDEIV